MNADIELALIDFPDKDLSSLTKSLPSEYYAENRSTTGWGIVICSRDGSYLKDIDGSIVSFLCGLVDLKDLIYPRNGVLRVAIYTDKISCTIRLKSFESLSRLGLVLEVSVYPSTD